MVDDSELITIASDGRLGPLQPRMAALLGGRAGRWRLVPSVEGLLILQRVDPTQPAPQAQGAEEPRILLCGDVDRHNGLVEILNFINSARWSGALALINDEARKSIYFKAGDVRMATSNLEAERVGEILYRYGVVTRAQLGQALAQVTTEKKVGQVLVETGIITVHDLYTYIRRQVEEIVYSTLAWRAGSFYFYSPIDERRLPPLHLSTQNLLMEGVRRIDEMGLFREKIPNDQVVVERRDPPPKANLEAQEQLVLSLLDGRRTIEEISRESRLGDFDATKAVFRLLQLGFARITQVTDLASAGIRQPEAAASSSDSNAETTHALHAVVDTFNTVFTKIYSEVRSKGKEAALRRGLESFFTGASTYADLFRSIEIDGHGAIPREKLLHNLAVSEIDNKVDYLYQGLNELLFFEMFSAGEALDRREEQLLQKRLDEIFRELNTGKSRG
jgi:hypothetical protein